MKKIIALLLAAALLLSLVACGGKPQEPTQPQATQPQATQPQATQPQATQPKPTEPQATQPQATEPQATEPQATEPQATQPQATEPQATEPKPTEPQATQPKPTEPKPTEPKPTEPPQPEAAADAVKVPGNKPSYAEHCWATKEGYVGIDENGYSTYTVTVERAGTYVLNMRYLSKSAKAKLTITVNDKEVFNDTCSKVSKLTAVELCTVTLKAGKNTLTITNKGTADLFVSEFFLNPDQLEEPKPTEPKPTEPKPTEPVATEPAATEPKPNTPAVTIEIPFDVQHAGVGGVAERSFSVTTAGTYRVIARVAKAWGAKHLLGVSVDASETKDFTIIKDDSMAYYDNTLDLLLELEAGDHIITLTNNSDKNMHFAMVTLVLVNGDGSGTVDPQPTEPKPVDPQPTEPKPTTPADKLPDGSMVFEAEKPSSAVIDTQNRTDMNGYPMDHSYRASQIIDGVHYGNNQKTIIRFCAFDTYTYEFNSDVAGEYYLYIVASCDRDSPIRFTMNGGKTAIGYFARNKADEFDRIDLGKVNVIKGKNTLVLTITENKNHNVMTDKYVLIPAEIVDAEKNNHDWSPILNAKDELEKPKTETTNKVWMELYVATNGKDTNAGTKDAPLASIAGAAKLVASLRSKMQGDIVVHIASGVYTVTEPVVLTVNNGGANGYRVIFRGDKDNKPVISGGQQVTGWSQVEDMDGVWSAPLDVVDARNLYINENMAVRARSEYLFAGEETYKASGSTNLSDGMIFTSRGFPKLTNVDEVELVFDSEWMHHRYPVANIHYNYSGVKYQVAIEMQQPYWHNLHNVLKPNENDPGDTQGFYVENAIELLDEPGEFYYNKEEKRIYYMPFDEEDLTTASCYVGVSEGLISIQGTQSAPVTGLTFENLQFKYGAWNEVSEKGMLTNQADRITDTTKGRKPSAISKYILGQFEASWASDLTIRGCVFACLGSSAVRLTEGVTDSLVDGNVFKDIAGCAISMGKDNHNSAMTKAPARIDVTNNVIRRIGAEYRSSPAIMMYYVTNIRVMHNDIACIPYSGISLGWGWGKDVKQCKDNVIAYNKIVDVTWPTHDGAHIYVLSPNYNTYINNNYLSGSGDIRGGIYPDEGAAHLNIFHNVIENVEQYWIYARPGVYLRDINAFQNFVDTDKVYVDERNVILHENTVVKDGKWPTAAKNIINGAGVSAAYKHLLEGIDLPSWHTNFVKNIPMDY